MDVGLTSKCKLALFVHLETRMGGFEQETANSHTSHWWLHLKNISPAYTDSTFIFQKYLLTCWDVSRIFVDADSTVLENSLIIVVVFNN